MIERRTFGRTVFNVFNTILLATFTMCCLYPIVYVLLASVSNSDRLMVYRGLLFKPLGFTLFAYEKAFQHPLLMVSYGNTLFIVFVGLVFNILLTSIGAYFLSRRNVLFQKVIAKAIVFTMFFSGGLIPFYFVVKGLGMYDSLWALIIPVAMSTYNMMVMRTSFSTIPESLEESARIDGAGHITVLFKIILPLSKSIVAVMLLYYGVAHWNAWFNAVVFIRTSYKFPLQLVLRQILIINQNATIDSVGIGDMEKISESVKYAIIIIATLPVLCAYPFLQKYFVKGVMIGAVKG